MSSTTMIGVDRFLKAIRSKEDFRAVHCSGCLLSREELLKWRDESGLDVLHYAILFNNADAVHYLLQMGYFAAPHEPRVNMYPHLAARLGHCSVLTTILNQRPEEFKVAWQPFCIPPALLSMIPPQSRLSIREHGFLTRPGTTSQIEMPQKTKPSPKPLVDDFSPDSSVSVQEPTSKIRLLLCTPCYIHPISSSHPRKIKRRSPNASFENAAVAKPNNLLPSTKPKILESQENKPSKSRKRSNSLEDKLLVGHGIMGLSALMQKGQVEPPRRKSSPDALMGDNIDTQDPLNLTPLQVAAKCGHAECVVALLDMYVARAFQHVEKQGYLTLACLANEVHSLSLLLRVNPSSLTSMTRRKSLVPGRRDDYVTALEVCLQNAYPECLGVLLGHELVDMRTLWHGVNFYHILYSQPRHTWWGDAAIERLRDTTYVLLEKGHSVNSKTPPRTFPLYSLVHNALSCSDLSSAECFSAALLLLLRAGADPNFNEVAFEAKTRRVSLRERQCEVSSLSSGREAPPRKAFSSALHCTLESFCNQRHKFLSRVQAIHFVEENLERFCLYGADIEKVCWVGDESEGIKGNVLYYFCKLSVTMGLDRALFNCIMRCGAVPHRKISGKYALNMYLERVGHLILPPVLDPSTGRTKCSCQPFLHNNTLLQTHASDIKKMISLHCKYMAPWHIADTLRIFRASHDSKKDSTNDELRTFLQMVTSTLSQEARHIHCLRDISAWMVWKLCHRKASNVKRLPAPHRIKNSVLPMLLFNTMWL